MASFALSPSRPPKSPLRLFSPRPPSTGTPKNPNVARLMSMRKQHSVLSDADILSVAVDSSMKKIRAKTAMNDENYHPNASNAVSKKLFDVRAISNTAADVYLDSPKPDWDAKDSQDRDSKDNSPTDSPSSTGAGAGSAGAGFGGSGDSGDSGASGPKRSGRGSRGSGSAKFRDLISQIDADAKAAVEEEEEANRRTGEEFDRVHGHSSAQAKTQGQTQGQAQGQAKAQHTDMGASMGAGAGASEGPGSPSSAVAALTDTLDCLTSNSQDREFQQEQGQGQWEAAVEVGGEGEVEGEGETEARSRESSGDVEDVLDRTNRGVGDQGGDQGSRRGDELSSAQLRAGLVGHILRTLNCGSYEDVLELRGIGQVRALRILQARNNSASTSASTSASGSGSVSASGSDNADTQLQTTETFSSLEDLQSIGMNAKNIHTFLKQNAAFIVG